MDWLLLIVIAGLVIIYLKLRKVARSMATQEEQLQETQALLRDTVAPGVTEIIRRLNSIPTDNPAIQDEIDGVKSAAQQMADEINAVLNPPPPAEG